MIELVEHITMLLVGCWTDVVRTGLWQPADGDAGLAGKLQSDVFLKGEVELAGRQEMRRNKSTKIWQEIIFYQN